MKKLVILIVCAVLMSGCSAMQKKADGRYFDIASNNNSEASIFLEKIVVDGKWSSGGTGIKGCGGSNINGGGGKAIPSYNITAPQEYIYLEWYSWHEMARMKAKVELPEPHIINDLLLNPPWLDNTKHSSHKSSFIIDFRPNHKVWVKLAKNTNPKSQNEIMILAESTGVKVNDLVTRYKSYKEGKNYILDCSAKRKRYEEIGAYTAPLDVYDRWYPGALENKEGNNEQ